ncbi:MAG: CopG family transcriptional regulator [Nocardioidaceae bacterium]
MTKTTLYLPDDLKQAVGRLSEVHGVSEAELIRTALASYVAQETRPRPNFPLLPSRRGPRTSDDARRVDELLAETRFGEC